MKQLCIGIVAHVDAGKTSLTEAMLYRAGVLRKLGRVDHGDAFLDTNSIWWTPRATWISPPKPSAPFRFWTAPSW